MKVLILGAYGMLGHKLGQVLQPNFDVWATCRRPKTFNVRGLVPPDRLIEGVTAEDITSVKRALDAVRPDAVINCIGVIKQQAAAKSPLPSIQINALFPHQAAALSAEAGARFIHFSTDCVFAGTKGMYAETDPSDATDLYGRTKFLGEVTAPGSVTIRSSILGPELENGLGLLAWFLNQKGREAKGFKKALYSGFTTLEMAHIVSRLLREWTALSGMWQIASAPINKFDLLTLINQTMNLGVTLQPDEIFACDRSLNGSRFAAETGYRSPQWPDMVRAMAADIGHSV